jgi:hypothetical protein
VSHGGKEEYLGRQSRDVQERRREEKSREEERFEADG